MPVPRSLASIKESRQWMCNKKCDIFDVIGFSGVRPSRTIPPQRPRNYSAQVLPKTQVKKDSSFRLVGLGFAVGVLFCIIIKRWL